MKKLLTILLCTIIMLGCTMAPIFAETEISVYIDGQKIEFDVPPVMVDDRVLVPMRAIFEALGANVDWSEEYQTATGIKNGVFVSFIIDSSTMNRNFVDMEIDVPAMLVDGRTMIPVRAVSEPFGMLVEWDEPSQRVVMTSTDMIQSIRNGDGTLYVGQVENGMANGFGTLYGADSSPQKYGYFSNNELLEGMIYYSDGSKAKGKFYNDRLNSEGAYWDKEGNCYDGIWIGGILSGEAYAFFVDGTSYKGTFDANLNFHGSGKLYFDDYYLSIYSRNGEIDRNANSYDNYGNYLGAVEIVDGVIYTAGTAPKHSKAEMQMYEQELAQIEQDIKDLQDWYNEQLDELYAFTQIDPFATDWGKSIMSQYSWGGSSSNQASSSSASSNGGNIDSFAAANAARQQQAFSNAGTQAVLAEYNRRLADMQQYIEETYARKQASIEKRLQALQQQFDMK